MGARRAPVVRYVTDAERPAPNPDEIELTLFGPGYGESIVLHTGGGAWVVVDSCIDEAGKPAALAYLEGIGLDPARAVRLIVASHWHDDHVRGMARLAEACGRAEFCCAAALRSEEFLAAVDALERRHRTFARSGVREIHGVFSRIAERKSPAQFAIANRRLFQREECEIWSLSPHDGAIQAFLRSVGGLLPAEGETKTRVPDRTPNGVAVALWARVADVAILLGSDLEKVGWREILKDAQRPNGRAGGRVQGPASRVARRRRTGSMEADVGARSGRRSHSLAERPRRLAARGRCAAPDVAHVARLRDCAGRCARAATEARKETRRQDPQGKRNYASETGDSVRRDTFTAKDRLREWLERDVNRQSAPIVARVAVSGGRHGRARGAAPAAVVIGTAELGVDSFRPCLPMGRAVTRALMEGRVFLDGALAASARSRSRTSRGRRSRAPRRFRGVRRPARPPMTVAPARRFGDGAAQVSCPGVSGRAAFGAGVRRR